MDLVADNNKNLDAVEQMMLNSDSLVEFPVKHTFTPGLYAREIFMPKGSLLTSKIHNTEHPFVVLTGVAVVHIPGGETEVLAAGHHGVTKAGTRRALYIQQDCKWVTFHPLSESEELARSEGKDEEEILGMIEGRIIERRCLPGSDGQTMFDTYQQKLLEQKNGEALCHG